MKILNVSMTVQDLPNAVQFYRDVLLFPVETVPAGAEVTIGSTVLSLGPGDGFHGVHHLAFGIVPSEFELAREWLARRLPLLQRDGSDVFFGGDGWRSRSLYFTGPEGIILEFIARDADAGASPRNVDTAMESAAGENPHVLSISEVGIGVDDVRASVEALSRELSIPNFYDCSSTFASMGGHDGLLIVVDKERLWFPNKISPPASGPLSVHIDSSVTGRRVDLSPQISVVGVDAGETAETQ